MEVHDEAALAVAGSRPTPDPSGRRSLQGGSLSVRAETAGGAGGTSIAPANPRFRRYIRTAA